MENSRKSRLAQLDGIRGISILSVLACHLLPLGPAKWQVNSAVGPFGMVLFFNLSGFLITMTLLEQPDARVFFIRRACRILPLSYLFIIVGLLVQNQPAGSFLAHLLFYANYTTTLTPLTSPLWSLCVEVQFYVFVGILVATLGRRALFLLPFVCVAVTGYRVYTHTLISIETTVRVDEILAGATLALVYFSPLSDAVGRVVSRIPVVFPVLLLLFCCHPETGAFNYLRPYCGALVVGHALWSSSWCSRWLESAFLRYLAVVSYALYVIHPIMRVGWFAGGTVVTRYLFKRPMGFLLVFALAHVSTFYYEKWWIAWGKKLIARKTRQTTSAAPKPLALAGVSSGVASPENIPAP
ncbi:MAG: acyltransferase family protein [Phycisphaerae bacterium]